MIANLTTRSKCPQPISVNYRLAPARYYAEKPDRSASTELAVRCEGRRKRTELNFKHLA